MQTLAILDISFATKIQNREKTIAHIKYWLKNSNFNILLISGPDGIEYYKSIFTYEISYLALPCSRKILDPNIYRITFEYFLRMSCICRLKMSEDIGCIYTVTSQLHDIFCLYVLKLKNNSIKTFATFDNFVPSPLSRPGNFLRNTIAYFSHSITKIFLIKIDYIFAYLNSPNFNLLRSYYSLEKKIIQFENGLNIELIRNIQFNLKYKFDIIYLGRIHEAKGIFDFLNTISELSKLFDNLKVAIAGSGDAFSNQKFHDYITQHNLGAVITFFGYVSTIDKYSLLKSSKIFMAPSYDESFPISTIEAYVCGCDIIAYDLPTYHNPPYINFSLKLVDTGSIQSLISNATNLLKISSIKKNPDISFITTYEKNASKELNIFLDV